MQAIEAYRKAGFSQLVLDGKHEYVEHYNFSSPFWQGRDRAQYATVVQGAEDELEGRCDLLPRNGPEVEKVEDYQEAAKWYATNLSPSPTIRIPPNQTTCLAEHSVESHSMWMPATSTRDGVQLSEECQVGTALCVPGVVPEGRRVTDRRSEPTCTSGVRIAGVKFAQISGAPVQARACCGAAEEIFACRNLLGPSRSRNPFLARQRRRWIKSCL